MHPRLFELFGFPIDSWPVFVGLGYVAALWVLMRLTPKEPKVSPDGRPDRGQVWDLFVVMVVSSLIGSKIAHVLFEADGHVDAHGHKLNGVVELLREDPWHWIRLGEGGYVWYGGLITALATAVFYFWRRPQLQPWLYADTFTPAIPAGAVLGRIGCFMAGCCHGRVSDVPWAVKFTTTATTVHPTQLYDAACALILAVVTYRHYAKRRFDGENIAILLMGYAVLRALTEVYRGDADRGAIGPLSTSQLLSIPMFLVGLAIYVLRSRASKAPLPA